MVTQSKQINNIDCVALTAQNFSNNRINLIFAQTIILIIINIFDDVVNINARPKICAKNVHNMSAAEYL